MYVIGYRAHFCHLPGLGQVGHSPRDTSGSDGTLDWGPMWLGSQSTFHSQCPPDTSYTPAGTWCPYIPCQLPNAPMKPPQSCWPLMLPDIPLPPAGPLIPYIPCQPWIDPWHPYTLCHPHCSPDALHPCQWECWGPGLGPNVVGLPVHLPPNAPNTHTALQPQCSLTSPASPLMPLPVQTPPEPPTSPAGPQHPLSPEQESSFQEWYYCRWAWDVISLWVRLLFCQMYPHPLIPLNAPRERHVLLSAIDCLVCYCHQFAIDHLHEYIQFTIYHL